MKMSFSNLLVNIKDFVGVADNSRKVKMGYVFVAIKGLTSDGHNFIDQARKNGAKIVVGEKGDVDIKVPDSRKTLSLLASAFYDNPSKKLKVIGVTGTDGKTTTASLIYWILKTAGKRIGLISTVSAKIGNRQYDTGFHTTNPEPLPLQKFLAKMMEAKCEYAVLEVTSHGLDQDRVYGIDFDIGVLTNITHEHLDYHKTFKNYIAAKNKLFENSKIAILNRKYAKLIKLKGKRVIYGNGSLSIELKNAVLKRFQEPYNMENATAAILTAKELKIGDSDITKAIKTFPGVEGRMQEIKNDRGIRIIIDFAHTPNALKNVLKVLKKQLPKGKKLIAVFGCAGERDIQKRPMMARISTDLADISVFTAEDPRSEKIGNIFAQMKKGIKNKRAKCFKITERGTAISFAINNLAKKDDIVVICGKGHEKSMNFGGVEKPWSDKKAVGSALKNNISAIILAAGKGTRMGGKIPKVLLSINGKSILQHSLEKIKKIGISDIVIVTGFKSALIEDELKTIGHKVTIEKQGQMRGTGGSTGAGLKKIKSDSDSVLVVYGDDSALYKNQTLQKFIRYFYSQKRPLSVAVIEEKGAFPLGGLEINQKGDITGVLNSDQITLRGDKKTVVLCGLLCFKRGWLSKNINLIPRNPKTDEYSLPYLFKLAYQQGNPARAFLIKDHSEWNSVNTPNDLKIAREKGEGRWKE